MKFILSGEGPSDLGINEPNGDFRKGAMTFLINAIAKKVGCSNLSFKLIMEKELKSLKKADRRNTMGRGIEYKPHESEYLSALYLGRYALEDGANKEIGVIFFKDTDGTNSAPRNRWEMIVKAMQGGFKFSGNPFCVPMVPRPKSEAWLLGYYQGNLDNQQAYNHCERFEEMPGNDNSPNSLKKLLQKAVSPEGNPYDVITEEDIAEIDWSRVDMPSLNLFRKRLENVLAAMQDKHLPNPENETILE